MHAFDKPIGAVRRRLVLQRFLSAWVFSLTATLALAVVFLGLRILRLWTWPGPEWMLIAAVVGVSLLAAACAAWIGRPSRLQTALAIDRTFALDERLSTALSLPTDVAQTPAGQAVLHDGLRHVKDLDVASAFKLRHPKLAWVPVIPALLLAALWFVPDTIAAAKANSARKKEATTAVSKTNTEQVLKRVSQTVAEKRKNQEPNLSAETGKVLAELEKSLENLTKSPPADKKQAMVELNKLADSLLDRRKETGGIEQINRQLDQLKELAAAGPAEQFARDLSRGQYQKAAEQLKTLQEKMRSGQLSENERNELMKQLSDLKKQLDQMANLEQQKRQLEEARKNGLISDQQYLEQKQKIDQQAQNLKALQNLAQKLEEAQRQMAAGNMSQAAQALQASEEQLAEMASQLKELEALDAAMADLQDAKSALSEDGMNQLGKNLEGMLGMASMGDRPGSGQGLGRGRGQGDRPEAPDDTSAFNSKVRQQITKGKAVMGGFADPTRQVKGESVLDIQDTVEASAEAASEALIDQKIPNAMRKHVRGYFDNVSKAR